MNIEEYDKKGFSLNNPIQSRLKKACTDLYKENRILKKGVVLMNQKLMENEKFKNEALHEIRNKDMQI